VQGFGNIEGRMPVLLLEAAWPRVRRKIRRWCLTGGASQRPSHRPWLGRVLFGYFFPHFERCLAPHSTLECACAGQVDVKAKHAVGFTFAACPALQRSIPARRQCSEVDLPIECFATFPTWLHLPGKLQGVCCADIPVKPVRQALCFFAHRSVGPATQDLLKSTASRTLIRAMLFPWVRLLCSVLGSSPPISREGAAGTSRERTRRFRLST
jgi:hypothetical protein